MDERQIIYYNPQDELNEEITIDIKKIFYIVWNRRFLIAKVFSGVLLFFVLMTFVSVKKYKVDADLYINKSNNSNMAEINPYVIEELGAGGGMAAMLSGGGGALTNELELMQSPLVIDKVIKENDIRYKKRWGIIPNKKEGEFLSTQAFLGKGKHLSFENKKGTNVVTIEYKSKDPELAYNVVSSIIKNYVDLHKQLNTEKSKSDRKVIETEYNKVKAQLNSKLKKVNGLPETAMNTSGNLSAMSAFSKSAQAALSGLKGQVIAGSKSRAEVTEESAKVAELGTKLEWARLVDEMSDTSKVLVLKEPQKLQEFEYDSPKLLINILLGIVFGVIASFAMVLYKESFDKKLAYSMIKGDILFNLEKDFTDLKVDLLANKDKLIGMILFDKISDDTAKKLQNFKNIKFIKADISEDFLSNINNIKDIMTVVKIGETDTKFYQQIRNILEKTNKNIIKEIIL